jgi:DNA-binding CsgD family transcriptional regulator/uncharacterized protein (DUF1778 family)
LTVAALYEVVRDQFGVSLSRATLLQLHEGTGGNPFYALEIARVLAASQAEPRSGAPLPVPKDLRAIVRARLSGLSPHAAEVLLGASALAQPTVTLLERAFDDADSALEEAISAGVVEIDDDAVRFSHPLLASVHYEGAPRRFREAIHRRLATTVLDREERARHLALALDRPNEKVAEELEAAARDADRRGAPAAAAELAELALARTDPRSPGRHVRTLLAADLQFMLGRTGQARALVDEALSETTGCNESAELLLKAAFVATEGESAEAAVELVHEGLALATEDALRARLLSHLALFGYIDGYDQAVAYGREAIQHAERSGDPAVLAECLAAHAWRSYVNTGVVLSDVLDRAAAIERSTGQVSVASGAVEARAQVLSDAGYFSRARTLYEELLALARERNDVNMTYPLAELACIDCEEGRFDSAAKHAKQAAEIAAQGGRLAAEGTALFRLAGVEAARGNVDETIELCERSAHLLDVSGLPLRGARLMRGRLELSLENYEQAWEYLDWSHPRNGTEGMGRPRSQVPEAIEALVGLGRLDEAREALEPYEARARELDRTWAIAQAAKCRGLIAAAAGDLEVAEAVLIESVDLEERAGRPFERARSLLALGTVQRRLRRKQAARATLREAHETFERLGARIWAARAEAQLRRIGGRTVPAGQELSATEERIVELVKACHTNREIAELMSLSPKTVEWNLSKVYRKLGVRSRTELAATR